MIHTSLSTWQMRVMLLTVLSSAVGYLVFFLWGGWHQVMSAIVQVGFNGIAIALGLSLVNYGLRFVRWQKYLVQLGHPVNAAESLRIYIAGFSLTIVPGKLGETIRSVLLKQHGIPYQKSLAAFLAEQVSNLASLLLLAAVGLWIYPQAQFVVVLITVLVIAGLVVLQQTRWLRALSLVARKRLPEKAGKLMGQGIEIMLHSRRCFNLPMLLYGIGMGLIAWSAEGIALYYIMHILGSELPLQTALFIYAFSMLVGAVSFMPGGLGGTEATMIALLMLNQTTQPVAVAATILLRLATLWFAVVLGVIALLVPQQQ